MTHRFLIALTLGCSALTQLAVAPAYAQTQLLTNGGFETGNFTGWTLTDLNTSGNTGAFLIGNNIPDTNLTPASPSTPLEEFPSVGARTGNYYAVTDATGAGAHALLQNFTVSAFSKSLTLSFDMFVNDWNGAGALNTAGSLDPNQQDSLGSLIPTQLARVDILAGNAADFSTSSADIVASLYLGEDAGNPPNPYTHYQFDLTSALQAGQSYRLRFGEVDNQFTLNLGVDNASLVSTLAVPEPGTPTAFVSLLATSGLLALRRRKRRAQ